MREVKNRVASTTPFNFTRASVADAQKYFLHHGAFTLALTGKNLRAVFTCTKRSYGTKRNK